MMPSSQEYDLIAMCWLRECPNERSASVFVRDHKEYIRRHLTKNFDFDRLYADKTERPKLLAGLRKARDKIQNRRETGKAEHLHSNAKYHVLKDALSQWIFEYKHLHAGDNPTNANVKEAAARLREEDPDMLFPGQTTYLDKLIRDLNSGHLVPKARTGRNLIIDDELIEVMDSITLGNQLACGGASTSRDALLAVIGDDAESILTDSKLAKSGRRTHSIKLQANVAISTEAPSHTPNDVTQKVHPSSPTEVACIHMFDGKLSAVRKSHDEHVYIATKNRRFDCPLSNLSKNMLAAAIFFDEEESQTDDDYFLSSPVVDEPFSSDERVSVEKTRSDCSSCDEAKPHQAAGERSLSPLPSSFPSAGREDETENVALRLEMSLLVDEILKEIGFTPLYSDQQDSKTDTANPLSMQDGQMKGFGNMSKNGFGLDGKTDKTLNARQTATSHKRTLAASSSLTDLDDKAEKAQVRLGNLMPEVILLGQGGHDVGEATNEVHMGEVLDDISRVSTFSLTSAITWLSNASMGMGSVSTASALSFASSLFTMISRRSTGKTPGHHPPAQRWHDRWNLDFVPPEASQPSPVDTVAW